MRIPLPSIRKRARIEIIPLIDIVFFLLATFVMVSLSMIKNQGIAVNLPSVVTGSAQEAKDTVTITVNDQGEIYLNKDVISQQQLSRRLKELKMKNPDVRILINGDEKAYFGKAVGILDEVRRQGITKVSIQTQSLKP